MWRAADLLFVLQKAVITIRFCFTQKSKRQVSERGRISFTIEAWAVIGKVVIMNYPKVFTNQTAITVNDCREHF